MSNEQVSSSLQGIHMCVEYFIQYMIVGFIVQREVNLLHEIKEDCELTSRFLSQILGLIYQDYMNLNLDVKFTGKNHAKSTCFRA